MKFVIPNAPMLITVPEMIWSTLCRMPSQASSSPSQPLAIIALMTPTMALTGPFPVARNIRLAETDATTRPRASCPRARC